MTKEEKSIYDKLYYQLNKEKKKQYYKDNKEHILKKRKEYVQTNKEIIYEKHNIYNKNEIGRANYLLQGYRQKDKKYNRGECTLTTDWIINNIFNSKCVFCGEDDWTKLGCDRIDNSKPHTPDNVQCCCGECNVKKNRKTNEEFKKKITN